MVEVDNEGNIPDRMRKGSAKYGKKIKAQMLLEKIETRPSARMVT